MEKELNKKKLVSEIDLAYTNNKDPVMAAYDVLKKYRDQGYTAKQLERLLTEYMLKLRRKGGEGKEDFVLEGLDFLVGWCSSEYDLRDK